MRHKRKPASIPLFNAPNTSRRKTSLASRSYLIHRNLISQLETEIRNIVYGRSNLLVFDVGCGQKPYRDLFGDNVIYIGSDIDCGSAADVLSTAENLPLRDAVVDIVLCSQVLEHVNDPAQTIREIARILRPGGTALVSTHGVNVYHPSPEDYWRWTQSGLVKLFQDTNAFEEIRVLPNGGTVACLFYLGALYASLFFTKISKKRWLPSGLVSFLGTLVVMAINVVGAWLDERFPKLANGSMSNTLIPNFLVVALKKSDRS